MNNGRRYPVEIRQKVQSLRRQGFTHREIVQKLHISLGSVWLWTKGITLTDEQKKSVSGRNKERTFPVERRERLKQQARKNFSIVHKGKYTRNNLLRKIQEFYAKHQRIPLKREFNMWGEYRRYFNSWNEAVKIAGFKPNEVIFSKKFIAKDRHICDSFAEQIIDDWLYRNSILHERNVPYHNTKMTADFGIGNVRVEYFGLVGEIQSYDRVIQKKKILLEKEGLKLIEIYPNDLFSKNFKKCLGGILKELRK